MWYSFYVWISFQDFTLSTSSFVKYLQELLKHEVLCQRQFLWDYLHTFRHDHFPHFCLWVHAHWLLWLQTLSLLNDNSVSIPVSYLFLSSIYFCFLPALSLLLASLIILFFFFVKYHLGFITGEKEAINYTLCCPMWWNEQQPCTDQLLTCFKEWSKLVTDYSSVQLLSHIWLFASPWTAAHQPPCTSPTPGVYSNLRPLSWWYYPSISSSIVPFSSCLQSFPASGSFQMNQFFASGGQGIGSFSFSISPSHEYSGLISFRMDWLDLLAVQGTPKSSPTP